MWSGYGENHYKKWSLLQVWKAVMSLSFCFWEARRVYVLISCCLSLLFLKAATYKQHCSTSALGWLEKGGTGPFSISPSSFSNNSVKPTPPIVKIEGGLLLLAVSLAVCMQFLFLTPLRQGWPTACWEAHSWSWSSKIPPQECARKHQNQARGNWDVSNQLELIAGLHKQEQSPRCGLISRQQVSQPCHSSLP